MFTAQYEMILLSIIEVNVSLELVFICLQAHAKMVPKIPSCYYVLLLWPSRFKFININPFVLK